MNNNRGTVSVEASIALPLFLFATLFMIYVANIYTVKAAIYEAAIETTEYMAEYAYLTDTFEEADVMDYPMAMLRFRQYADSQDLIKRHVLGGMNGISFIGSKFPDDDGYIDMRITYVIRVNVPVFGNHWHICTEHIKQKAYLGRTKVESGDEEEEEKSRYVYVAENGVVYHDTRSCTYLMPNVKTVKKKKALKKGYRACKYCGAGMSDKVYITSDGDCYHSSKACSRLKRTVKRVKLSETNLPPCSKCSH